MTLRSGLAWLSSSSAEIARARSVLDALTAPGVIDELGFQMLNAAFAERLFPGVTTIVTRARYLIFIPAIYRYLEQTRKAFGKDADRVSRDLQFDLRNALKKNEKSFIGKEGGIDLVRVPSAIYWSALGALGIAAQRISEASYQRRLAEGTFGGVYTDDDGSAHDDEVESLWDPALKLGHILPEGKFPTATSFRLRNAEAKYLEARYATLAPDGHENLVTRMVSLGRQHGASSLADIEYPWDIPCGEPNIVAVLDHARRLSLVARGATLQYYRMLTEQKKDDDTRVEDAFFDWWEQSKADLASWDVQGFFRLMTKWQAGRGAKDREFIVSWIEQTQTAKTGRGALADRVARLALARREDYVRPGKQRLRIRHQLDSWKLPDGFSAGLYQMDYRHPVGRRIARDIVEGLERGTV